MRKLKVSECTSSRIKNYTQLFGFLVLKLRIGASRGQIYRKEGFKILKSIIFLIFFRLRK